MQLTDTYETTDINLATAIFTAGHSLVELNKTDPYKVGFLFANAPGLDFIVSDYWNGKLKLSARSYADNLRMMKNRLYR